MKIFGISDKQEMFENDREQKNAENHQRRFFGFQHFFPGEEFDVLMFFPWFGTREKSRHVGAIFTIGVSKNVS